MGEDDFEDEDFDDFVILDRPEIKGEKYNKPEALEKQAKLIEEDAKGEAQCVLGKEGVLGEKILLDDFKIKRVIDKGSFGKVYLVVNQKTRTMYAMKRINKDILIEKKQITNIKNEKDILFQANHPFVNSMDYVF